MVETLLFYVFAAAIVFTAVMMVLSPNIFHSAIYLALCLFGVAAIFAMLGSFFLAGLQVLIYIGAVVVLTIFVISLTRQVSGESDAQMGNILPAFLTAGLSTTLIILAVLKTDWNTMAGESVAALEKTNNVTLLGNQLISSFVLPFEVISVLLLAALIGAVVIVSKDAGENK
ncbi:MAG: NADH-quinone oxidoreductase subunit J [Spirochaetia bacterium]|nr:NADH-quinone oxidoreductase subunit J [Spirochaetia bacterium]